LGAQDELKRSRLFPANLKPSNLGNTPFNLAVVFGENSLEEVREKADNLPAQQFVYRRGVVTCP
jgi:hypothetical protein